jgi:hypothetical protein
MAQRILSWLSRACGAGLVFLLVGCVEDSSTVVTFDTQLESVTFTNNLLAPIAIYRDGAPFDTIPARGFRTYRLDKKGPIRHGWKLIAPTDRFGRKAGIEPFVDLGVQYPLNASYTIDNESVTDGSLFGEHTIFTPIVANATPWSLRLIVNYQREDQVYTDYLIPRSLDSQFAYAPYFYWNQSSNVRLESINSFDVYFYTREDTLQGQTLELSTSTSFKGSGATKTLVAE